MASGPVKVVEKPGNLLDAPEDLRCHQCNCISRRAKGLAAEIFKKYPYTNTYIMRTKTGPSQPGSVYIDTNSRIVNMYAQYSWKSISQTEETFDDRIYWFQKCLDGMLHFTRTQGKPLSFAFPYNIGCGLAGGTWELYLNEIKKFSQSEWVKEVVIYHLDE